MKTTLTLLLLLLSYTCYGQIAGTWHGTLQVTPYYSLPLVVHISTVEGSYTGTLDSPEQRTKGIVIDSISYNRDTHVLQFESKVINSRYQGTLSKDTLQGFFFQNGNLRPLQLTRKDFTTQAPIRPYQSTEVRIPSGTITLSGTITEPYEGGKPVAVVLVAGSGPNDRDSKIGPHTPLADIADHLTRKGYTVLRYDKRGVGKSTGSYTTSTLEDFKQDAIACTQYMHSQEPYSRVGIIGHSEGGLIAEMVAAEYPSLPDFIVLLAAPGVSGIKTITCQNKELMKDLIKNQQLAYFETLTERMFQDLAFTNTSRSEDSLLLVQYTRKVLPLIEKPERQSLSESLLSEKFLQTNLNSISSPYYKSFLRADPSTYLPHITCPILALNGSKDRQVEASTNLNAIQKLATQASSISTIEMKDLNHLFIPARTGLPQEYLYLPPGFSTEALELITNWLDQHTAIN